MCYARPMVKMSHDYARKVLGVGSAVTPDALRKAWKKQARKTHPDQNGGSDKAFIEVNEAYDVLRMAPGASRYTKDRQNRPPKAQKTAPKWVDRRGAAEWETDAPRTIDVGGQLRKSCRAVLERATQKYAFSNATLHNGGFYVDPRQLNADSGASGHIAQNVAVANGKVTVKVSGVFAAGLNSVSMPCGTRAGDAPSVVSFRTKKEGAGRVVLPEAAKSKAFPWAKEVQVVFTK